MSKKVKTGGKGVGQPRLQSEDSAAGDKQTNLTAGNLTASEGGVINVAAGDIQYTQIIYQIQSSMVGEAEARELENLPPQAGEPPFLGLQYFDEKDAPRFFGREDLTARIIGRLHRTRFLAIIGASGSGKSSVVRAGVIPSLRKGERLADGSLPPTDSGQWLYRVISPTAHPMEALAVALAPQTSTLTAIHELQQELTKNPGSFTLAVQQTLIQSSQKHLVLVVDQFEEIFTQCRSPEERQAFIDNLLNAVQQEDQQSVTVLLTLRADFYAQVAAFDGLREAVSQHQEFIGAMSRTELLRAIVQPLAQDHWKIQEGLVEVMLDDVGYEPGALPLLSHAMLETWKRRRGRTLTLSGYTEAGGVRGAIAFTAETVFCQRLTKEQQPIAQMIFIRLAELNEDSQDTRRRAEFSELITRSTDEPTLEAVLHILTDARLVTLDTAEPGDVKVIEVAHEALIREWPTLREWLAKDRQGLILQRQLTQDTQEWLKLAQDPGILYRGTRLEAILAWAENNPDQLSLQEQEFIETSQRIAAQEAEQARRLARSTRNQRISILVIGSLVIAMVTLVLTGGFLKPKIPPKMNGFFNVAIAELVEEGADPNLTLEAGKINNQISQALAAELGDNPNIQIWHDTPELARQGVTIGPVLGINASQQAQSAQELAQRLNANMILFGNIDHTGETPQATLQIWLAPDPQFGFDVFEGGFQFGTPVTLITSADAALPAEISNQVKASAWIALGLAEEQLGHSLESIEAFSKASEYNPTDMIHFFIGQGYLFLVDRENIPDVAKLAFDQAAEQEFQKAIDQNPQNTRAIVGLATVFHQRAQRKMLTIQNQYTGEILPLDTELMSNIEQALQYYQKALDLIPNQDAGNNTAVNAALLGLGVSHRLRGEAYFYNGQTSLAERDFDMAIQIMEPIQEPITEHGQTRLLALVYQGLGTAYQWQGYLKETQNELEDSQDLYRQAADYYTQCISVGKNSADLITKNDTTARRCAPYLEWVQGRLEPASK
jgi:tetratricopeptide (TPR) repeat protein